MENEIIYDRRYDGNHDEAAERAFDLEERRYQRERYDDDGPFDLQERQWNRERHDEDAIEGRQSDYPTTCRVAAPFDAILAAFLKGAR